MPTLIELAQKYGTDKMNHGYIPFYEMHLPKNPKRILEIGVNEGRSLAMWAEYFPECEIWGLDLFNENSEIDVLNNIDEWFGCVGRIYLYQANQCNFIDLEVLRQKDFDIIIDDGSHNARDQMISFFGLFNGKHYFIEDMHCNQDDFYSQGLPDDFRAKWLFGWMNEAHSLRDYGVEINYDEQDKIVCIRNVAI